MSDLLARLQTICGPDHVSDVLADRLCYRRDCGPTPGGVPDLVVRPESTSEVVEIVKLANQVRKPIFLWGRATTFIDHGVREGCIVMALDLMKRVLKIDLANQVVTAETGAIWHAVDSELNKLGWEMTVPGGGGMFSCTVGGTVAYNAVPPRHHRVRRHRWSRGCPGGGAAGRHGDPHRLSGQHRRAAPHRTRSQWPRLSWLVHRLLWYAGGHHRSHAAHPPHPRVRAVPVLRLRPVGRRGGRCQRHSVPAGCHLPGRPIRRTEAGWRGWRGFPARHHPRQHRRGGTARPGGAGLL